VVRAQGEPVPLSRMDALRDGIDRERPVHTQSAQGGVPDFVSPWADPYFYEKAFVQLFPFGAGGPGDQRALPQWAGPACDVGPPPAVPPDPGAGRGGDFVPGAPLPEAHEAADDSDSEEAVDPPGTRLAATTRLATEDSFVTRMLLRGHDRRFQKCPGFVFAAYYYRQARLAARRLCAAARGGRADVWLCLLTSRTRACARRRRGRSAACVCGPASTVRPRRAASEI